MSTRETVTIKTKDDRLKIARWANQTAEGTVVTFRKKSRSTEQSAKMWAMLGEVASQVDWYGQKLDAEAWKDVFTASLRHARVVPGIDKGTFVPLGMHTSTMTIEEMTNLIELIYAFGAEHNVVFKDPKPDNSNSGASSSPGSDDAPLLSSESEPGEDRSSGSHLSDVEWLRTAARMLWSATNVGGDTDANLSVLNNQRLAVGELCPPDVEQAVKDKAGSIYRQCKSAVLSEIGKPEALKIITGIAGMTPADIGGEANG